MNLYDNRNAPTDLYTVKPVLSGHLWDTEKVAW